MPESPPLKGKRFEQKPKVIVKAPDFGDHCGVMHDARLRVQLNFLLDCISNGFQIPEEYYSDRIDKQGDRLLSELGVKHLHLSGPGSDIIVYMAEFENWVELIEINTHVHLESEPRGAGLKGAFRGALAKAVKAVKPKKKKPRRRRHRRTPTSA